MFNEPEYGYILSDETGSIKVAPFHGNVGYEYEITGEVIGSGEYATLYNPEVISHDDKPDLHRYQAKYEVYNPVGESPFARMVAKEKAREEEEEKQRKILIIGGVILVGILFWWFALHNGGHATAICNDGHTSYSRHHSGTCSDHGGVQEWLDGSDGSASNNQ
ncbi:MAG TPA: DUF3761 domain-containing protein [Candidatus Saccharimonadales bacterium]|nr:DUF3761 domain-containing protein [Candidatus Saccharimonadales bacterium]